MTTKTKKTYQKPIELDLHLKYRCPDCGDDHWLSMLEAKTKGFKIVCSCGMIIHPKRLQKIQLSYISKKIEQPVSTNQQSKTPITSSQVQENSCSIPADLLKKSSRLLMNYGFIDKEAEELIKTAYEKSKSTDTVELMKQALKLLEIK